MNKKHRTFVTVVGMLGTFILLSGVAQAAIGGPTCNVPGDYLTISLAVADPGYTTINVAAGT